MSSNRDYRKYSEIWNFNRGMITKVDHAVGSVDRKSGAVAGQEVSSRFVKILDIGCGVGTLSLPLASRGYSVVAVDIDPESIRFCEDRIAKHGIKSMECRCGRLHECVEPDQSFDWVILADVLEHIEGPEKFLDSLKGYLKPGGSMWISVPNEATSLSERLPTFRIATAIKFALLRLIPRALKRRVRTRRKSESDPDVKNRDDDFASFRPLYFNYSLNEDSPHVQEFTFRTIQETVARAGYDVEVINGGSLFYKVWPFHRIMDRIVTLASLDHRIAQVSKTLAGNWWLVATMPNHVGSSN